MSKIITLEEMKKHNNNKDCWITIHDIVYDVTSFLDDHPGGDDAIIEVTGGYATKAFDDIIHSDDAKESLKQYKIGELAPQDKEFKAAPVLTHPSVVTRKSPTSQSPPTPSRDGKNSWVMPTAATAIAVGLLYMMTRR